MDNPNKDLSFKKKKDFGEYEYEPHTSYVCYICGDVADDTQSYIRI